MQILLWNNLWFLAPVLYDSQRQKMWKIGSRLSLRSTWSMNEKPDPSEALTDSPDLYTDKDQSICITEFNRSSSAARSVTPLQTHTGTQAGVCSLQLSLVCLYSPWAWSNLCPCAQWRSHPGTGNSCNSHWSSGQSQNSNASVTQGGYKNPKAQAENTPTRR